MNNSKVLNEDICKEILLRLPVKSVTKFQLVCRRWFSIISTDHFRRLHTLGHPKPPLPSLILNPFDSRFLYFNPTNPTAKLTPFSIKLANNPKHVTILSSCSGLLLLKSHGDDNNNDLFVYNPTTRQSRTLCLSHNNKFIHVLQLHLVFDPTISIHYKIVCLRMGEINSLSVGQIEVFDSKSGTWNVCGVPLYGFHFVQNSDSTLHYRNKIYGKTSDDQVYSFDLNRCGLCTFARPRLPNHQGIESNTASSLLHVSNGCLYYVSLLSDDNEGESAALWHFQLNGNNFYPWFLKYHDGLSRTLLRGRPSSLFRFIAETSTLLIDVQGKIVAYNFRDKSYHDFLDLKKESCLDYSHMHLNYSKCIHHFGQTLAPL